MRCPSCNHDDTRVVDTRASDAGLSIRRRRVCVACSHRFSTGEYLEILDVMVVKRDGRRVQYNRDNVEAGIKRSLEKRPYTPEAFARLVTMIERDIQSKRTKEISSEAIGEVVMHHLRMFDKVGYIRFASVYLNFSDVETFATTAEAIRKKRIINA